MSNNNHFDFIKFNPNLFANATSFFTSDLNLDCFEEYFSKTNPNLLSRTAYLRREEIKDQLSRFEAIFLRANELYPHQNIEVEIPNKKSWLIPIKVKIGKGLKIPSNEKIIIINDKVYLFSGFNNNGVYKSYSIEKTIEDLNNKNNYMNDSPVMFFDEKEITLEVIKNKLIKYMRDKIRLLLRSDPDSDKIHLYKLTREMTPLEESIKKIYSGQELHSFEKIIYDEFPLFGTCINKEIVIYVDEETMHIQNANVYFPKITEEYLILLNPILVSDHKTDRFSTPINVDIRALHINYGFEIKDKFGYEDFLFEPNWILCPIILYKKGGMFQGKIIEHPKYFIQLLDNYLKNNQTKEY